MPEGLRPPIDEMMSVETEQPPVQNIAEQHEEALHRIESDDSVEGGERTLHPHQDDVVKHFASYLRSVVEERKKGDSSIRMARIVAAPRTGKTTIVAEIIRRTGLDSVFLVPSGNLIEQARREFLKLLPGAKIASYGGGKKEDMQGADVIVGTYQQLQSDQRKDIQIPPEMANAPLLFADEGHEAMTKSRLGIIKSGFDSRVIRIALTG